MESQSTSIRRYCSYKGLELLNIFEDQSVSGGLPLTERKGGGELLKVLDDDRTITNLVIMRPERMFRSMLDCLGMLEKWEKSNIIVHTTDFFGQALSTETHYGRITFKWFVMFADIERENSRDRMRTAHARKRERGEAMGQVPFGWRKENGMLVIDEQEQEAIRLGKEMRAAHMPYRIIAAELERRGFKPRGSKWHVQTVIRAVESVEKGE